MVLELAKDALRTKVKFETAIMTGNYECAYASGLLTGLAGATEIENYPDIATIRENAVENVKETDLTENKWKRLYDMLKDYEPSEKNDEQMRELYSMGISEYRQF